MEHHRTGDKWCIYPMVLHMKNAIHHWIAEIEIRRAHVYLRAEGSRAVRKLTLLHALEQIQVFFNRAIAIRTLTTRLNQISAVLSNLIRSEIAHISLARPY